MRELLTGPKRFTGLPGISPKTLSSRLQRLVGAGLVTAGERLKSVLDAMGAWAEQDLPRHLTLGP